MYKTGKPTLMDLWTKSVLFILSHSHLCNYKPRAATLSSVSHNAWWDKTFQMVYKHTYFAEDVWVWVVLQQHGSSARVIIACRDVQGRKTHFALGAIVYQEGHHVFVTLLKSYCQRSKAILWYEKESCRFIWVVFLQSLILEFHSPRLEGSDWLHVQVDISPLPSGSPVLPCTGDWNLSAKHKITRKNKWIKLFINKFLCLLIHVLRLRPTWDWALTLAP